MAFIKRKKEMSDKPVVSVQKHLIKLYENRGDEHILRLNHNHKVMLRAIMNNHFSGRYAPSFTISSINQAIVYDLLSWGMVDYEMNEIIEIRESAIPRHGEKQQSEMRTLLGQNRQKVKITHYGIAVLNYFNLSNKKNQSGHNNIIYDFIKFKKSQGSMVFEDIAIRTSFGESRPDVFTIEGTLVEESMKPTSYEIKHSRSDFLSDMKKPHKWQSYLEVSEKLYYVCPEGVIKKEDVPKECGLIYQLADGSFKNIKQAKKGKGKLTIPLMMKLLLRLESDPDIVLLKPCFDERSLDVIVDEE